MKQTWSLAEFIRPSKFTLLYPMYFVCDQMKGKLDHFATKAIM